MADMTGQTNVRRGAASLAGLALLGSGLTACSSTPAVCTDVSSVKSTTHQLQSLQLGQNTISDLQKDLKKLSNQVGQLASDASQH